MPSHRLARAAFSKISCLIHAHRHECYKRRLTTGMNYAARADQVVDLLLDLLVRRRDESSNGAPRHGGGPMVSTSLRLGALRPKTRGRSGSGLWWVSFISPNMCARARFNPHFHTGCSESALRRVAEVEDIARTNDLWNLNGGSWVTGDAAARFVTARRAVRAWQADRGRATRWSSISSSVVVPSERPATL